MSLINKIDQALDEYYKQLKRNDYRNDDGIGKFHQYVEDNGFDSDAIKEELHDEESILVDFDKDFPCMKAMKNESEKKKEILSILQKAAAGQAIGMSLDVGICSGMTEKEFNEGVAKYTSQMSRISYEESQSTELKYFMALGVKCGFPFITYVVDSYTNDKAELFFKNGNATMKPNEWAAQNKFMKALKTSKETMHERLLKAMQEYSHRLISRLELNPMYVINDKVEQIVKYLTSTSLFINKLVDSLESNTSFQIDLVVAVKGASRNVKTGDDDEKYDEKKQNPNTKSIGDVAKKLKEFPLIYTNGDIEETKSVDELCGILSQRYDDFKVVLSAQKDKRFDSKTYPKNRRFSIFVDRRRENDQIIYFQPPHNCNTMETDHIPEIGVEFVEQCVIPEKHSQNTYTYNNITASDAVNGELITFMFNVEQKNEIRCYIIWSGGSMRFHGYHIKNLLPILFEKSDENMKFKEGEVAKKMITMFNTSVVDRQFDQFYYQLTNYK
eukprot:152672_1